MTGSKSIVFCLKMVVPIKSLSTPVLPLLTGSAVGAGWENYIFPFRFSTCPLLGVPFPGPLGVVRDQGRHGYVPPFMTSLGGHLLFTTI